MSATTVSPELTRSSPDATAGSDRPLCAEIPAPPPGPEHAWLQRFVGEWDSEIEIDCGPDQPRIKSKGSERGRIVGGFWLVVEGRNEEFPYVFQLTLGFDPQTGSYVGTWIDSMSSHLWRYVGLVDASGCVLTLDTEGPFPPGAGGTLTKFREVTEFKSNDHRVFTSSRLDEAGRWVQLLRIEFRRRPGT